MASRHTKRFRVSAGVSALAIVGLSLGACSSLSSALGNNKLAPDEFRVVTKAPLVVPPDYALRPPSPGEPRPQELQPESQARLALIGQRESAQRSAGETLLANRAGAASADPLIRYVVDDQYGNIAHKERSFADRVMFWRKGQPNAAQTADAAAADTPSPVDPSTTQKTVAALTGGKAVIIQRAPTQTRIKLPGL